MRAMNMSGRTYRMIFFITTFIGMANSQVAFGTGQSETIAQETFQLKSLKDEVEYSYAYEKSSKEKTIPKPPYSTSQLDHLSQVPKMEGLNSSEQNRIEDIREVLKRIPSGTTQGNQVLLEVLTELVKPEDYWVTEYLSKTPKEVCGYGEKTYKKCFQIISKIGLIPKNLRVKSLPNPVNDSGRKSKENNSEQRKKDDTKKSWSR